MVEHPNAPRPAASAIGRKDNDLVLAAAKQLNVLLPLADFLRNRLHHQTPRRAIGEVRLFSARVTRSGMASPPLSIKSGTRGQARLWPGARSPP